MKVAIITLTQNNYPNKKSIFITQTPKLNKKKTDFILRHVQVI